MLGCFERDLYDGKGFLGTKFFGYLLSVLFVMHIYWYSIMMRSVERYFKTGKADDLHQRINKKGGSKPVINNEKREKIQ